METAESVLRSWRFDPVRFVRDVFGVEPDAWQADVLRAFPENNRIAMKACKGPGKGARITDEIETPSGHRVWGDLEVGDEVFGSDGRPTAVTGVFDRGELDVYRVTFDDGSHVDCDPEHLWKVRGRTEKRHGTWSVQSVEQLLERGVEIPQGKGTYRQFQIPAAGPAEYPEASLPLHPYFVGAMLGDGCKRTATLSSGDDEIPKKIAGLGYDVSEYDAKNRCVRIRGVVRHLKRLGIYGSYAYDKRVPVEYMRGASWQRLELLRGLMDTDGCVGKKDSTCTYDTTSPGLAEDVVWLVRSLGGKAVHRKTKKSAFYRNADGEKVFCRDCYRVGVTMPVCPFGVARKVSRWRRPSQDRYLQRTIVSIEKVGRDQIRCISVAAKDRCYLAPNFTVTHNSCVLAWLIWNFLLTRPHPKVACTSVTGDNLKDGLWTELAKWQAKSSLLLDQFSHGAERIVNKEHHKTWWCRARTWPKSADVTQQADTLAGLHADYLLFVLDEAGGIPDAVMATAEAGLSTGVETKLMMAGNPTLCSGPLYRACTREKNLWFVVEITGDPDDPKRSPRIDVDWARQQIEKYGRNNPWVLVNVFGKFPPGSLNSLLGPEHVEAAMARGLRKHQFEFREKRIGLDPARFGDDSTVMFPRQGLMSWKPRQMRNYNTGQVVGQLHYSNSRFCADGVYVDGTGGYGAGIVDGLHDLRWPSTSVFEINFSSKPDDPRFYNKRAEMWFRMAEWVKKGGALPHCPELVDELTTPTYSIKNQKLIIEPKEHIKQRLGRSPDYADALALTFAMVEMSRNGFLDGVGLPLQQQGRVSEFDPISPERLG